MQKVLEEQGVRYRQTLYTPLVVVWAWLSQVLDVDKSLGNAVNRAIAWIATSGEEVPSADTGAYSKARKRLPLGVIKPLLKRTAAALQSEVKPEQRWCGRRVKAYDGTSVLMSDKERQPENLSSAQQSESGMWVSVGEVGRVVLWNDRSRPGSGNRRV